MSKKENHVFFTDQFRSLVNACSASDRPATFIALVQTMSEFILRSSDPKKIRAGFIVLMDTVLEIKQGEWDALKVDHEAIQVIIDERMEGVLKS